MFNLQILNFPSTTCIGLFPADVGRMSVSLLLVSTYTSNKQLATKQSKKHTQIERNKPQIHAIGFVVKGVNLTSTK